MMMFSHMMLWTFMAYKIHVGTLRRIICGSLITFPNVVASLVMGVPPWLWKTPFMDPKFPSQLPIYQKKRLFQAVTVSGLVATRRNSSPCIQVLKATLKQSTPFHRQYLGGSTTNQMEDSGGCCAPRLAFPVSCRSLSRDTGLIGTIGASRTNWCFKLVSYSMNHKER